MMSPLVTQSKMGKCPFVWTVQSTHCKGEKTSLRDGSSHFLFLSGHADELLVMHERCILLSANQSDTLCSPNSSIIPQAFATAGGGDIEKLTHRLAGLGKESNSQDKGPVTCFYVTAQETYYALAELGNRNSWGKNALEP